MGKKKKAKKRTASAAASSGGHHKRCDGDHDDDALCSETLPDGTSTVFGVEDDGPDAPEDLSATGEQETLAPNTYGAPEGSGRR